MENTTSFRIEENASLAPYTTLGIGGPARFLIKAKSEEHVIEGLSFARKHGCPIFVLGGGSNVVVSDSGFPGLVLRIELEGIEPLDAAVVSVAAGEDWDRFVKSCVDQNLAGVECMSGIPGTVGGTPVQNVGAYGADVSEVIQRVRVLARDTGATSELSNAECRFAYRSSIFNSTAKDRYIVLSVDFALRPGGEPRIRYQDLRRQFSANRRTPSIGEVREAVLRIRSSKGMVLRKEDPESKSAGSFFKNPVVSTEKAAILEEKARSLNVLAHSEQMPRFEAASGQQKLAAAWLIERAGFGKGYTFGHAGISNKHSLALVNRGGASAQELMDLVRLIQERVRTLFDVELEPEPVFVGFAP